MFCENTTCPTSRIQYITLLVWFLHLLFLPLSADSHPKYLSANQYWKSPRSDVDAREVLALRSNSNFKVKQHLLAQLESGGVIIFKGDDKEKKKKKKEDENLDEIKKEDNTPDKEKLDQKAVCNDSQIASKVKALTDQGHARLRNTTGMKAQSRVQLDALKKVRAFYAEIAKICNRPEFWPVIKQIDTQVSILQSRINSM